MVTTTFTKLSQDFVKAFSAHDMETILSLYTEDGILENIGENQVYHGKQEVKKYFNDVFTAFPDARMEIKTDFRSGDWAATEWIMTGTNTGKIFAYGTMPETPATGNKMSLRGVTINQYRGDKVSHGTSYWNLASFLQQLGLMPGMPAK